MADATAHSRRRRDVDWTKSTFSGTGDCVEVAFAGDGAVQVRDSKDVAGPQLHFTHREWTAFVAGVRDGQFDPPGTV